MCSAFATREKSGEITPACVRWLARDVCEATTTKDRDFFRFSSAGSRIAKSLPGSAPKTRMSAKTQTLNSTVFLF